MNVYYMIQINHGRWHLHFRNCLRVGGMVMECHNEQDRSPAVSTERPG